jgi:hypothetical protein
MNQGNANPGTLGNDFGLFGMVLWADLQARYPTHAGGWNQKLLVFRAGNPEVFIC